MTDGTEGRPTPSTMPVGNMRPKAKIWMAICTHNIVSCTPISPLKSYSGGCGRTMGSGETASPSGILSSWCSCAAAAVAKYRISPREARGEGMVIFSLRGGGPAVVISKGITPQHVGDQNKLQNPKYRRGSRLRAVSRLYVQSTGFRSYQTRVVLRLRLPVAVSVALPECMNQGDPACLVCKRSLLDTSHGKPRRLVA